MKANADARAIARHVFAAHRGVRVGPEPVFVRCACCGLSPYGISSRPKSELISDSFSDLDLLLDPTAPDVCAGCAALLGGRPGDDPPPFRTLSVAVPVEAARTSGITLHNGADLVRLLTHPPRELFAVSWSASRKKHAWLRSEACDGTWITIGTDNGLVTYVPSQDAALLDAVTTLLGWFRRDAVESGAYPTPMAAKLGVDRLQALEAVVTPYRPSALLSLLVSVVPLPERSDASTTAGAGSAALAGGGVAGPPGLDPADEDAVQFLHAVAAGSAWRQDEGIAFWSHLFRRRVQRFKGLPLADFASRLIGELRVRPQFAGRVALMVESWPRERRDSCMEAIRARSDLLIVIAYGRKENR